MKVLFFNSHPEKFGSQIFLVDLLESINKKNELECSVLTSFNGELNTMLTERGIDNRVLPLPGNLKFIFHPNKVKRIINICHSFIALPIYIIKLHKFLKNQKLAVLYNNNIRSHVLGSIACFGLKTKVILHIHGMPDRANYRHYLAAMLSNKIIFNSKDCMKKLEKYSKYLTRFKVVYNGIDFDSYHSAVKKEKRQPPIIGVIGAIRRNKGQIYAIKGFAAALKQIKELRLKIIGEEPTTDTGEYMIELRKELINEKIERSVDFNGYMEIKEAINSIDLLVLPTLNEAFGRVIIEAMAMDTPVIASKVGGIPEIIEDGKNGLLVEPKDHEGLCDAIVKTLTRKLETDKMVETAREDVKSKFSMDSMVDEITKTIKDLAVRK